MQDAKLTPIYSPHPAESLDPQAVIQAAGYQQTGPQGENYPLLPWPLEALPGTIWRNLWTGTPVRIASISTDQDGNQVAITEDEAEAEDEVDAYHPRIGSWQGDRFCIAGWVRVDHLPPATRLAWQCVEIAYLHEQMYEGHTPRWQKQVQEEWAIAIKQARHLAAEHSLPIPSNILPYRTFSKSRLPVKDLPEPSDIRLTISKVWNYTFDSLQALLATAPGKIALHVPCPSVDNLRLLVEGMEEYLRALFIGETIAEFCETIAAYQANVHIYFVFRPRDIDGLASKLLWLGDGLHEDPGNEDIEDEDLDDEDTENAVSEAREAFESEVDELAETMTRRVLRFPHLGDNYLELSVLNEGDSWDEEAEEGEAKEYPGRKFGFWRSCASNNVGFDVYMSSSTWILPLDADIELLFATYRIFEDGIPDLYEAIPVTIGGFLPLVFNQTLVVHYPLDEITKAQQCAEAILLANSNIHERIPANTSITKVLLSEDGLLLIASDAIAQYVLFADSLSKVSSTVLHHVSEDLRILSALANEKTGK